MPYTATATPYTTYTTLLGTTNQVLYGVGDAHKTDNNIPLVIYTHGNDGAYSQFADLSAWAGLRDWLIDNGWAWVEGYGGGGDSWGNQEARDNYEQAYSWVTTQINTGPVVVLGRSMGGLVAYWLYSKSTIIAPNAVALIVNSGTTDLTNRIGPKPGAQPLRGALGIADDGSNFDAVMSEFDPMLQPLDDWTGKKVIQLWGSADTTVPPADNGQKWALKYGSSLALFETDVRAGGDHTQTNGSYLQTTAMVNFIFDATGIGPLVPPDPPTVNHILARYRKESDGTLAELSHVLPRSD